MEEVWRDLSLLAAGFILTGEGWLVDGARGTELKDGNGWMHEL